MLDSDARTVVRTQVPGRPAGVVAGRLTQYVETDVVADRCRVANVTISLVQARRTAPRRPRW